ncbi:unnamed protein product, partial [Prorocentrum cordatum]
RAFVARAVRAADDWGGACAASATRARSVLLTCIAADLLMGRGGKKGKTKGKGKGKSKGKGKGYAEDDGEPKTTIMLRGLPPSITGEFLLERLDAAGYRAKYDFVYLPVDFNTRRARGYAFVNFPQAGDAKECVGYVNSSPLEFLAGSETPKKCSAGLAIVQGKVANIKKHSRSSIAGSDIPDGFKPMIFNEDGEVVPTDEVIGSATTGRDWDDNEEEWWEEEEEEEEEEQEEEWTAVDEDEWWKENGWDQEDWTKESTWDKNDWKDDSEWTDWKGWSGKDWTSGAKAEKDWSSAVSSSSWSTWKKTTETNWKDDTDWRPHDQDDSREQGDTWAARGAEPGPAQAEGGGAKGRDKWQPRRPPATGTKEPAWEPTWSSAAADRPSAPVEAKHDKAKGEPRGAGDDSAPAGTKGGSAAKQREGAASRREPARSAAPAAPEPAAEPEGEPTAGWGKQDGRPKIDNGELDAAIAPELAWLQETPEVEGLQVHRLPEVVSQMAGLPPAHSRERGLSRGHQGSGPRGPAGEVHRPHRRARAAAAVRGPPPPRPPPPPPSHFLLWALVCTLAPLSRSS